MPYCRQSSSATPQWRKTSLQPVFHVESAPRPFGGPAVEGWQRLLAGSSATLPPVVADTSSFRSRESEGGPPRVSVLSFDVSGGGV